MPGPGVATATKYTPAKISKAEIDTTKPLDGSATAQRFPVCATTMHAAALDSRLRGNDKVGRLHSS
jgi:hypothetical protein